MPSDDVVISVKDLGKCFHVYASPSDRFKQFILPRIQGLTSKRQKQYYEEFWALNNASFEIKKGESVGIVGRNGSGKSTLLQLICGTLNPSNGSIKTNGRIAALLELGSGFNPEFTGRENVYLNGTILGLKRREIDARFDEIAAFADIGAFIDQPIKTYSSGMVVRLAFAIVINVDPQILIVDEALSVGDELFQRKCFSKLEAIRARGATILFVSHSGSTVVELCDKAILLDDGEILATGIPKKIVGRYQKLLYVPIEKRDAIRQSIKDEAKAKKLLNIDGNIAAIHDKLVDSTGQDEHPLESYDPSLKPLSTIEYESYGAHIESPDIFKNDGTHANNLLRGNYYRYSYNVVFSRPANNVRFGMLIKTTSGVELGGAATAPSARNSIPLVNPGEIYRVNFTFRCSLNPGIYFLNAGVVGDINGSEVYLHRLVDAEMFRVVTEVNSCVTGIVDFECSSKVEISS
ncbi:MAG: ABC transporter ATP-binding protein [Gammaproteobacteria bacterium]|nr:ABC transporter ATP-binding protein [Gammaproteobacteria bacterium]